MTAYNIYSLNLNVQTNSERPLLRWRGKSKKPTKKLNLRRNPCTAMLSFKKVILNPRCRMSEKWHASPRTVLRCGYYNMQGPPTRDSLSPVSFFLILHVVARLHPRFLDHNLGRYLSFLEVTKGCCVKQVQTLHSTFQQLVFHHRMSWDRTVLLYRYI